MAPVTRKSKSSNKDARSAASNIRKRCNTSKRKSTARSAVARSTVARSAPAPSPTPDPAPDLAPVSTAVPNNSRNENHTVDFSDPSAVSGFIATTNVLVGDSDKRIHNLDSNTTCYAIAKKNAFKKFFEILSKHPSLHNLAKVIKDPECGSGVMEHCLIILCRGVKTKAKYNILNSALLVTASNVKKITHANVDLTKR